jgi:pyruvate kinase
MRRTKIVATIGPASRDPEVLVRLVEAGMDVARLNFSHGNRELHAENAERVRAAASAAGRQVAILQDLPGPKLRVGPIENEIADLKPGDALVLICGSNELGNESRMSVSWAGLADAVDPGDVIYLADGKIRLRVAAIRAGDGEVETEVEVGGAVASRQGLNIPGSTRGLDAVPAEDLEMLRFGEEIGVDLVALSFVRTAEDITSVRKHTRLPLIAKIEKPQAMVAAEDIIRAADCVMVARGEETIESSICVADHGHADARLDGLLAAPNTGRGDRRRQRNPRRDRRGDALAGDGGRPVPGRDSRDDGVDRRVHGGGPALREVERRASSPGCA